MNKIDAQTLATRLTNLYSTKENEVKFTLPNFSDEEKMKDCFYVGIWLGDNIVGTTDETQFDTLLRFARILVQTEEDLLQIGRDPNLDPTYANRMLMQANEDLVHGEIVQRVQSGTLGQSFLKRNNLT